jgi:multiple sugar transport system substrate-binding protein
VANPNITLEVTAVPEDLYVSKFETAQLAGDSPDVATLYSKSQMFYFEPLNDAVYANHGLDLAEYNAALVSSCGYESEVYCVGTTLGAVVMLYNKEMFDAAGLDYPSASTPMSWEQFAETAGKLTVPSDDITSYVFGGGADAPMFYSDLATFLSDDGRTVEATKPGFVSSFETLAGMVSAGDMPSADQSTAATGGGGGIQSMFVEGQLAMVVGDNYMMEQLESAGIDYGIAPVPVEQGTEPWTTVWTDAWGIPTGAAHPAEAATFLAFLANEAQAIQGERGFMPLRTSDAEAWADSEARSQLVEASKLARVGIFHPDIFSWTPPLMDAYTAVLRGDPALATLEEAEPKAQEGNDRTWELWDATVMQAGK